MSARCLSMKLNLQPYLPSMKSCWSQLSRSFTNNRAVLWLNSIRG